MFAREEFYQMSRQVEADRIKSESETFIDLFRKPSYRKRFICGGLTMFAAMSSGILVIYSTHRILLGKLHTYIDQPLPADYSVILYQGLGFTGGIPLCLSAAYVTGILLPPLPISKVG